MIQKHRQENISVQGRERKQVSERRSLKDIVPRAVNTLYPALRHSVKQWRWSPPTCHLTSSVPVKNWQAKNSQLSGASAQFGPYCWLRPLNYCSPPSCSLIWICRPSIHTSLSWIRSCPFMSLFEFHLQLHPQTCDPNGSEAQSRRNITSMDRM